MNSRFMLGMAWLFLALAGARAIDPKQRSDSSSQQFTVYCEDVRLRYRVVSFVEEVKAGVLQLLALPDRWKAPIVITIEKATIANPGPPSVLRLVETPAGPTIAIDVRIGDDPAAVNLQKQIVRAVLLEFAYRDTPVQGGTAYVESPWWVIEGAIQIARTRDEGIESDLYKALIEVNKLPPIEEVLAEKPAENGATALAFDQGLALCLIQLLIDQPHGRQNLSRLVRDWPHSDGNAVALLKKEFPSLALKQETLQKWWTLNLARFSAMDRYAGMTAQETEKELVPLLKFETPPDKTGGKKTFAVGEFDQYLKVSGIRLILSERHAAIIALGSHANALFRPVIADYEAAFASLAKGRKRGVRERLAAGEHTRALVLRRTSEIADYLNWYEATQMGSKSNAFDSYLKAANEISEQDRKRTDPIARYLDDLEQEF
jgi:hypothetical protein